MILPHPRFGRQITEHVALLVIPTSHAAFLAHVPLWIRGGFQQPARISRRWTWFGLLELLPNPDLAHNAGGIENEAITRPVSPVVIIVTYP